MLPRAGRKSPSSTGPCSVSIPNLDSQSILHRIRLCCHPHLTVSESRSLGKVREFSNLTPHLVLNYLRATALHEELQPGWNCWVPLRSSAMPGRDLL